MNSVRNTDQLKRLAGTMKEEWRDPFLNGYKFAMNKMHDYNHFVACIENVYPEHLRFFTGLWENRLYFVGDKVSVPNAWVPGTATATITEPTEEDE